MPIPCLYIIEISGNKQAVSISKINSNGTAIFGYFCKRRQVSSTSGFIAMEKVNG